MGKMKAFLKTKGAGFYFGVLTTLILLGSFISYLSAANDSYGYDGILIGMYVVALALNAAFLVKDFLDAGAIVTGVTAGLLFGMFIRVRFTYFATGILGISQEGISGGIVLALVSLLLIVFINFIGAFFVRDRNQVEYGKKNV